ncbi:MAG: SsrA-binding protein SmpB [Corallococcus sp.]|nr:SsrA-binding protein SmpB [Corallococcus sp.]
MIKLIATNKKAFHDYFVTETLECGINLIGCEVKSIRQGEVNLADSYCEITDGQLILRNMYIKSYDKGSFSNAASRRDRRLLAAKREIMRMLGKVKEKGYTVVPLKIYFKDSLVKLEIALVKGKKLYDKRDSIAVRDINRDTARAIREYTK